MRRSLVVLAIMVVLGACTNGGDDETTTPAPSQPERVEVLSDFQLVGEVDEAFAGAEPKVDVPDAEQTPVEEDASGPTLAPDDETPFGTKPPSAGVMRITVEDASSELSTRCGVIADDAVDVYWTTDTSFDPADVLDDIDGVEDEIEGRVAGVAGRILGTGDMDGADTPRPTLAVGAASDDDTDATGSPDVFGSDGDLRSRTGATDCVLVADQVGFEAGALPTPSEAAIRPVAPRVSTAEPRDEPDETQAPAPTAKPTRKPKPISTPRETATSTAEEDD